MRTRRALITSLAAVATAMSFAATAQAEPTLRAVTHELDESRAEVLRYWTEARLRRAEPADMPAIQGRARTALRRAPDDRGAPQGRRTPPPLPAQNTSIAKPRLPRPARATARASWYGVELPWLITSRGYTNATNAVGRLFYLTPEGSSFCSASVVAVNVIVTAAHCVRDSAERGSEYSSFVFVPGKYGSSEPFGRFTGRAVSVWNGWYEDRFKCAAGTGCAVNYSMDYAFITLRPNAAGYNVGQYTGWYGLWTGAPQTSVYVLGYPGEGTWSAYADYPYHCRATPQSYYRYVENRFDVGLSCHNTGGSSGGPWFQTASDGRSYVSSVMSHMGVVHWQSASCVGGKCPRYGNTFFGPYFDADTSRLLAIARGR
jgi:V8-like Glu-specific endopeptidase